ncbi:hypothetical protein [Ensifer sp. BR816]|uniref:hypothetical protein n=1 Tax=Rhizobium sp. (strain BR816) TaxID=1057002 RepID=UPI0012FC1AB6|nr:hypothetical protein [Ensifer sp. BR816]
MTNNENKNKELRLSPLLYAGQTDLFSDHFLTADPVPSVPAENPLSPAVVAACAECGATFEATRRAGRPFKFCCDPCRLAHRSAQSREWNRAARVEPPVAVVGCQRCGRALPDRSVAAGRMRLFCSKSCSQATWRRRGKAEGAEGPKDLFDGKGGWA